MAEESPVDVFKRLSPEDQEEVIKEIRQEITERTASLNNAVTRVNVLAPIQGGLAVGAITLMAQVPQLNKALLGLMVAFELLGLAWSISVLWHHFDYLSRNLPVFDDRFSWQVIDRDPGRRFQRQQSKLQRRGNFLLQKRRKVQTAGLMSVVGICCGAAAGLTLAVQTWGFLASFAVAAVFTAVAFTPRLLSYRR